MIQRDMRVGVLMGGFGTERGVSLKTGGAVLNALLSRGWNAVKIDVGQDLPARLKEERVEVAWLALHGQFGEDGCVQGLLEVMGIPYTGSGVKASAVAMDKLATKRALAWVGDRVVMAKDWVCRAGETPSSDITLPAVVKPCVGGSTIGIELVHDLESLGRSVSKAIDLHPEVLVEEMVEGDEITVAVLDGVALPVVRIIPESGFFDYEAKYTKGETVYEAPAKIDAAISRQAQEAAVVVYNALGCEALCRVDFIVRKQDDVPVMLEINTLPGMTATSLSPMSANVAGIGFEELVERVLLSAHRVKI